MKTGKCPDCGCRRFYIKDIEDQFTIYEFDLEESGKVVFEEEPDSETGELQEETEVYCDRCAWHDKFKSL